LMYANPEGDSNNLNTSLYGLGLTNRFHFRDGGREWWPYLAIGAGAQRHEIESRAFNPNGPVDTRGNNFYAQLGGGVQADYGSRFGVRGEVGYRMDFDSDAAGGTQNHHGDFVANLSLLVKI